MSAEKEKLLEECLARQKEAVKTERRYLRWIILAIVVSLIFWGATEAQIVALAAAALTAVLFGVILHFKSKKEILQTRYNDLIGTFWEETDDKKTG